MSRQLITASMLVLFLGITTANPVGAQTSGAVKSGEALPAEAKPKATAVTHVVLVVDSTVSMAWPNRESQLARITLARKAASLMVDLVPAGTPLSVLGLQDGVSAVRPMSPLRASDRHGIRASLNDLKPKGHGKLSSCFSQVERVLKQTPQGEQRLSLKDVRPLVVIITDGDDCQASDALGYASVLSSQVNDELRLALVGLCTREAVAAPLRSLATSTHGWFTQLETENGLEAAFARTRDECNAIRKRSRETDVTLVERNRELDKQVRQLEATLARKEKDLKAANETGRKAQTALDTCKKEGIAAGKRIGELEKTLQTATDEKKSLEKELKDRDSTIRNQIQQVADLKSERTTLQADLKTEKERANQTGSLVTKITELTTQEKQLADEIHDAAAEEKAVREALGSWHPFFNSSIGVALISLLLFLCKNPLFNGFVKSLTKDTGFQGVVKTEVDTVTAEVGGVKSDVGVVTTEVGNVKNDVGKVTAEVGTVKTEVSSVKSEVTAVKSGIDEVKSSVDGVKAGVEEKVQKLSSQVAEQLSSFDRLLAERMQKFEAQLRETSLALTSDIGMASSSVKTVETKVDSTKAKADEIEKAISAVQSQLSQTDQAVAAKVASLETAVAETRSDVKESIKEGVSAKLNSVEKTVSESKTEVRQLVGESQRTLASQMTGLETSVSSSRDEIVSSVQTAITASEKSVESTCRESALQVAQKVDGIGQTVSDLHADQKQLDAEVRHVSQSVNPLAKAVAETQAGMHSQSAEARVEMEKKFNKLTRDVTKAIEKVHGRIELRTKEIGEGVREAQEQMDQKVRKQVRRMGDTVAKRVSESVSDRFAEQQELQQGALNGVHDGQRQLQERIGQIGTDLESLRTVVSEMPEMVGGGVDSQINALAEQLAEIASAADSARSASALDVSDSMTTVADSMSNVADSVQSLDSRLNDVATQIEQLQEGLARVESGNALDFMPTEIPDSLRESPSMPPEYDVNQPQEVTDEQLQAVKELRRVKGIGPAYAKALYQAGVASVEALATLSDERIAEVDETVPNVEDLIDAARMFLVRER